MKDTVACALTEPEPDPDTQTVEMASVGDTEEDGVFEDGTSSSNVSRSKTYMTQNELMDVHHLMSSYMEKQKTLQNISTQSTGFWTRFKESLQKFFFKSDAAPDINTHDTHQSTDTHGGHSGEHSQHRDKHCDHTDGTSTRSTSAKRRKSLNPNDNLAVENTLGDIITFDSTQAEFDAMPPYQASKECFGDLSKHDLAGKFKAAVEKQLHIRNGAANKCDPTREVRRSTDELDYMSSSEHFDHSLFVKDTKMINPNHSTRQKWDMLGVLTALLYTAVRVPYTIAFDIDEFHPDQFGWFLANRFVDVIFVTDMIITFRTAIQEGEELITNQKKIAKKYLQTWFVIDLISSVPFDVLLFLINGSDNDPDGSGVERSAKLLRVFKIVRILRLVKFQRIFLTLEIAMGVNFSIMSIIKFLFSIAMLAHLMACVFAGIDYQSSENWITQSVSFHLSDVDDSVGNSYIAALYWAISTISSVGYGDIAAHTAGERWFSCLAMILGGVMFTYGLTHIVHLVSDMNKNESKLFAIMEHVEEWAEYYDFPSDLLRDIKLYFRYKADFVFADEQELIQSLTDAMKRKICEFTNGPIIRNVAMFHGSSESLITEILLCLNCEFAPPHCLIITEGSIPSEMFIIRKGKVACYKGELDYDFQHQNIVALTKGQSFGEVSFILPNMTRIVSALALTWCDLLYITKRDFIHVMKYYPTDLQVFETFAKQKNEKWANINTINESNQSLISTAEMKKMSPQKVNSDHEGIVIQEVES